MINKIDDIESLFKQNYPRMHRLASALLHDPEAAHDIVHDVFTAILDDKSRRPPDEAYLLASVRNRCLNRLKTINIKEKFRQLYLTEKSIEEIPEEWPDEEMLLIIEKVKEKMPPKCREVFSLRFQDGLSTPEISELLGIGERTVYKHLNNALTLLKTRLNGQS